MIAFKLLAPLALIVGIGCAKHPQTLSEQTAPVEAGVITVSSGPLPTGTSLTGVVAARQTATISSQVMAPITQVLAREGDHVRKGQVLVRLSSATLAAGVQQAESQVNAARQQETAASAQETMAADTLRRYETLNERHSVTPHEYEQVKSAFEAAQAQRQAASAQVEAAKAGATQSRASDAFTVIRAPFSGVVTARYVDPGALAAPGSPLLRVEGTEEHEIDVQMNESTLSRLHVGDPVQVTLGSSLAKTARIREIVPSADPAAHTFTLKIAVPRSQRVISGMTASVLVPTGQASAISIPRESVLSVGQMDAVLALDKDSVAQRRYVSLGRSVGDRVEVSSGLMPGDRILARPDHRLAGRRIEARP